MGKQVSDEERVAYHEAGHAVAAYYINPIHKLKRVTIVPSADFLGCNHAWPKPTFNPDRSLSESEEIRTYGTIVTLIAGAIAEKRSAGRGADLSGSDNDFEKAFELANNVCGNVREVKALIAWLQIRAQNLIHLHYDQVKALAAALMAHKTLRAAAVREVIKAALLRRADLGSASNLKSRSRRTRLRVA